MDKLEKKVADNYNAKHGGDGNAQQQQPQQQEAAPPPPPPEEEHHHGKNFAKNVGHAVTFGAGATAGADIVNSIVH